MYRCVGCHKSITEEEEHFYLGYWFRNKVRSNVIHYHSDCLESIAGSDHVERIKLGTNDEDQQVIPVKENTTSSQPRIRWRYETWEEK